MNKTQFNFEGRTAIITGGAGGIGLAIAQRLMESGARIMLWDLEQAALDKALAQLPGQALGLTVNVADESAVSAAAKKSAEALGQVDILVNAAGISRPAVSIVDYPLAYWDDTIAINLSGSFYCCRAVVPFMIAGKYGRIINISSMAGKDGNPLQAAYAASKSGIIGLTKSLGKELAAQNILVNAIAPTIIDTPMHRKSLAAAPDAIGRLLEKIPLGRRGTLDEIATLAAFIASDECSFTTGFIFDLSGGRATY